MDAQTWGADVSVPKRPVLRYHGGKWVLSPWIIAHFPEHRLYVEPFCGAASVLLRKPRAYAEVINDTDKHVVNLFRILRDTEQAQELRRLLELTPFARDEFNLSYEHTEDNVETARRLIVRSFMGFGGATHNVYRKTGFNYNCNRGGPIHAQDWANYPRSLDAVTERLRGVVIENRNAIDVIRSQDGPQTLHYVDPPYVHASRAKGQQKNYTNEMTDDHHRDLASVLHACSGMVLLSGYTSELYSEIYAGWNVIKKSTYADGAKYRTECLWFNAAAWNKSPQIRLELDVA